MLLPETEDGYADAELAAVSASSTVRFVLRSPTRASTVDVAAGTVTVASGVSDQASFSVVLTEEDAWDDLLSADPPPRRQHVLAHLKDGGCGRVEGDEASFARHLHLVRRTIEAARPDAGADAPLAPGDLSHVRGGYTLVDTAAWGPCDIYVERAGSGRPIVLLATAGSDTRQYHGLFQEDELLRDNELIAIDLPWHGKSSPARSGSSWSYRLDAAAYVDVVAATIAALGLDRPIVFGASMAGGLVVQLAALRPDAVSAVIGAQAGPRVAGRRSPFLRSPAVDSSVFVPEWVYGLTSPRAPRRNRDQIWWGYSQGGSGVYDADIAYYTGDWDIDRVRHLLDGSIPVVLLSGVYDYSVPPERTRELAASIPGSSFREMPELGHFPHAENPPVFARHLRWALDRIDRSELSERHG